MHLRRSALVAAALLAPAALASADDGTATALFDKGVADLQAGNLDLACRELAASLDKAPDSGTKGALATCLQQQGKSASAWTLWKDLADTAPSPALKSAAAQAAAQLEPKLAHYVIKLAADAPAGLVVTINGNQVPDPTLPVALPVDPGTLVVVAHAPDHKDWTATFQASEAQTTTIDVPALPAAPHVTPPPGGGGIGATGGTTVGDDHGRRSRHVLGLAIGGAGALFVLSGGAFGLVANKDWSDAQSDCGGNVSPCTGNLMKARNDTDDARTMATFSTVLVGIGAAAVVTGAVLYFTAPAAVESQRTALHVIPTVSPGSSGIALFGHF